MARLLKTINKDAFLDEETADKYIKHQEKINEAEEKLEYVEPYPIEMRREFWKHNLNPITGMKPVTNLLSRSTDYYQHN
jgi:hypothetical protein